MCAFSISASGKRCLLETANVTGEYTCRTSAVEVEGIVNHVESDECVAACGVDRKTVGISSDAMMEAGFAAKLCSPACLDYCPNILDLYFNLAAGEGTILSFFFVFHADVDIFCVCTYIILISSLCTGLMKYFDVLMNNDLLGCKHKYCR